ncbi:hypothetical protein SEA_GREKAYCON_14 [Arthrobacter phage Grekaycon]|uniref:Uncharacterized protein n=5 Tax=Marthavirus TaxID=1980936 RepID=A0A514A5F6_9CAUD|nr:hypothetical protein FDH49_gp14 [Arthrobacter phage Martha]YP_009612467.1 hypothetical protein FDI42_gp14 [Arthrobacter phage Shade]ALY10471.1 hypothetical protein TAEYOUNG_14 [Arthrobacter phage TaeYoung]QDH48504.1 hypothetical protein SEA_GREKAYCON_14 [Arthrobacter phage Grekaycon]QED11752.1 hypothetical protein SEA_BOSSLADY_14 [Arthrobacter phage BossLady]ALY09667.1 hypothetical protein MARTHA_14 [Arthrobacter phage Martha]ASR80719.1 hypothetical protein SEA_SHADE_14 [Arthrobacter phage
MSKATTIHNAMAHALVVDQAGHIVGGGETADIEIDAITYRLIDNGSIVIVEQPEPEEEQAPAKKTRASRQPGVDEKNGD